MRFLFIDANYPAFLDNLYRSVPGLPEQGYAAQMAEIRAGLFGEAQFQAQALVALGHEAEVVVTNAHAAQRSWAIEHGLVDLPRPRRQFRRRRGVIPWWSPPSSGTVWEIVLAQARAYRPDVLYVEIMDTMPAAVADHLRTLARFAVAQVATDLPATAHRNYDLVLSSIPDMVDAFRSAGIASDWMPLAFEPRVLDLVAPRDRDISVSFVGSFTNAYADRDQIIEAVARATKLETWTTNVDFLAQDSAIRNTIRGSAFGREMYEVLARSRITLNSHGTVSGADANNLRLYEATGMGALLITDARRNLSELFDVGREVVTFQNPEEAGEVVRHYLDHPNEASRIAGAGQARTLREHTWMNRMARVVEAVQARM
jgi:spore maturation protein CgeB